MEVENQNMFATSSKGKAKGKRRLREHMAKDKQNSFEDLFNEGGARGLDFTNSNHSEENLFDDFDDPFEDERDHATTVTPVDKPERAPRESNSSPKGVDEQIGFDPFSALGNAGNSFYQKREFGDGYSDDDDNDVEKSPLQQKLQNIKSTQDSKDPFKATSTTGRRSTMSHFAPVSSMALQKKNDDSGFALPAEYQNGKSNDRRAAWNRRASTSNLNLSSHSSHSSQSDTTGMATPGIKTPRRAGKRPDGHHGESTSAGDDQILAHSSHGEERPRWGRFASMTNLSKTTSEMPAGFAVPATPCGVVQKLSTRKLFGNSTSPNQFTISPANPSRRMSVGVGMATPKTPVLKMIRRASVATGLGGKNEFTMTPKLTRRASVSTGLANDPSTPVASMRVRIRQQRKGSATGATNAKVDEDTVRRLVKEHLAKEKQKKKEQVQTDDEEREHDTAEEDESERSETDDDSAHSFEDDASTSCSSRSSSSSRWDDEGDRVDEVPRLLKRHESNDGDTLLPGWSPEDAAETLKEGGDRPKEKVNEAEGNGEQEEEQKVRKKPRKVGKVKKDKPEKPEKRVRKVKKKKVKAKAKSGNEDTVDDDEGPVNVDAEETTKAHSSVARAPSRCLDVDEAEVLSAIKLAIKKKVKKPKKTKKKDPDE